MSDSATTTAAATATSNPSELQLRKTTPELETVHATSTSVPPGHVSPENANTNTEEDLHEELKKRVAESLDAHRIASEATVKMLQRNVELDASSTANLSGGDEGNISTRPDLISDFK
ncbi:hypothetical protein F5146DRAFT_1129117 [Armillaria mellea]|nr:hypothetical protein F5146DRAFT_1129117 [Armillaria mellea]